MLSIFGHMLLDFIEIFQDGAFPNLEYHFFQVNWSFNINAAKIMCQMRHFVETDTFIEVLSIFGHI